MGYKRVYLGVGEYLLVDEDTGALVTTAGSLKAVSDPITLGESATLESVAPAILGLTRVTILPSADAVGYYAVGKAASAATAPLPAYGISRPCNAADYAKIRVFGTAGKIVVEQYA